MENPYVQRTSTSPVLAWVWSAKPQESGSYMDLASEYWHIAFLVEDGGTRVLLNGPANKSRLIAYQGGQYYWGVVFRSHVCMVGLPKKQLLNAVIELPTQGDEFLFGGQWLPQPSYQTADTFADDLAHRGLIAAYDQVANALAGTVQMSTRSLHRHLVEATGLSNSKLRQIERARQAFAMLQQGIPLAEVAVAAGYSDQAHLTKSLKLLAGQTPGQILADYNPP